MTCQDCINQATDFIDDALTPLQRARHASHLEQCTSCARYDRVLRRGIRLVHDMPQIQPSPGFRGRLHRRLRTVDDERIRRERIVLSGATVAVALAGLIALAAWAPVWQEALQRRQAAVARGQFTAMPTVELPPGQWWYEGLAGQPAPSAIHRVATFPGPYSPLVVQPPSVNTAGATAPAFSDGE